MSRFSRASVSRSEPMSSVHSSRADLTCSTQQAEVSLSCLLEYLVVRGQLRPLPLQPAVPGFQLLQAPRLIDPEATLLSPPAV